MSETIYYIKRGRRYVPALNVRDWTTDTMQVGQSRLETCTASGQRVYQYRIEPDYAPLAAALALVRDELVSRIRSSAIAEPSAGMTTAYTADQLAFLAECRERMAQAGVLLPASWDVKSAHDIAQAVCELIEARTSR
jgi:hypothetical protein